MQAERRNHPRRGVVCRVDYADTQGRAWLGLIRDVSMEGMFVEYAPDLTIGNTVVTTFTLPGSPPFKLWAKVMRLTPSGAGLKFIGLSEQITDRYPDTLEAYCAALYRAWMAMPQTTAVEQSNFFMPFEHEPEQTPACVGSQEEE